MSADYASGSSALLAGEISDMRILAFAAVAVALGGCVIQRAQIAQDARVQMVGWSKEQVLVCMGPPASKAAEGQTEVWSYNSGDGTTIASALSPPATSLASRLDVSVRSTSLFQAAPCQQSTIKDPRAA